MGVVEGGVLHAVIALAGLIPHGHLLVEGQTLDGGAAGAVPVAREVTVIPDPLDHVGAPAADPGGAVEPQGDVAGRGLAPGVPRKVVHAIDGGEECSSADVEVATQGAHCMSKELSVF